MVNYIFFADTAFNYNTEESIGKVLKDWLDCGKVKREELFITTKVSLINQSIVILNQTEILSYQTLVTDLVT